MVVQPRGWGRPWSKPLLTRRPLFSPDYPGADQRRANDLILPVQRGSSDLGAFIAMQSLEGLLRVTLPAKGPVELVIGN